MALHLEGLSVMGHTREVPKDKFSFSLKDVKLKGYDQGISAWVVEGRA